MFAEDMHMSARFELVQDPSGKFHFQLRGASGEVLLQGLACDGKIAAQTEVQHVRKALQDPMLLVDHAAADGTHFVVIKDRDGSVLARSPHVASEAAILAVCAEITSTAEKAPLIDLSKQRAHHAAH